MGMGTPPGDSVELDRGLGPSLRRRSRDESGSILVIFALFLTVFLLIAAVVVDVGYWWVNGKKAQIAADACALAAAQELPQDWGGIPAPGGTPVGTLRTECLIGARDFVLHNLPAESNTEGGTRWRETRVVSPYDFDKFKVEATVRVSVRTFFGRFVGLDQIHLTRRAVAEQALGTNEVTIHGHDTNCGNDNIKIGGDNNVVGGMIESNGKFEWNGMNFTSGPATAGGPGPPSGGCEIKVNGTGASFGGDPEPAYDPTIHPWPAYYVRWENGLVDCDVTGTNLNFSTPNEVIPDGVYCASQTFEVNGEGTSGNITVIAPKITINAQKTNFKPSTKATDAGKPVLFFHIPNSTPSQADDNPEPYCEHRNEMKLNGFQATWEGVIFNPCDRIVINGAKNAALKTLIEGMSVEINGEFFNIQNYPLAGGEIELALVE